MFLFEHHVPITSPSSTKQIPLGDGEPILDKSAKLRETQLLAMIRHPYIVAYEESYVEEGYLYVVMEYAGGGTMERYTDAAFPGGPTIPSLDTIKSLFVQLVLAGCTICSCKYYSLLAHYARCRSMAGSPLPTTVFG